MRTVKFHDQCQLTFLSRFGTLSLNLDFASTDAARTGSVGDRQAPIINEVGILVRKTNHEMPATTIQLTTITGPSIIATLFQWRLK